MQAVYRLTKNIHFKYVYRTGKSIACKNLIMLYTENNSGKLKVGFSVSKKIGKAVVRNKVKRRMKEAFRQLIPLVSHKYNYVLIARDVIVDDDFSQILQSMKYMLKKTALFTNQAQGLESNQNSLNQKSFNQNNNSLKSNRDKPTNQNKQTKDNNQNKQANQKKPTDLA